MIETYTTDSPTLGSILALAIGIMVANIAGVVFIDKWGKHVLEKDLRYVDGAPAGD